MSTELVVIGGGPAGLSAALAAADAGVQVTLVEGNRTLGGQYYRQPATGPGTLPAHLARADDHPNIELLLGSPVWGAYDRTFHLLGGQRVSASAIVVATGATELTYPFPGWDLPGVVTAGAAQALLKGQDTLVGRRVVVAGSGPFLLPVAAGLAAAGADVAGLFEATRLHPTALTAARHGRRLTEAAGYLKTLSGKGIRLRTGRAVVACLGADRVERAVVARVDRDWRPVPGSEQMLAVDAVCVSFGFVPALELPRALGCREVDGAVWHDDRQATDIPGVFVAGETTGIGGVRLAEAEGTVAGLAAARYLGHAAESGDTTRAMGKERRFAQLLPRLYPRRAGWLDWLEPDTVFCRCEETPWAAIEAALETGAVDARAVKALSRCGMGYCQGRVCGPPLTEALQLRGLRGDLQRRVIGTPIALQELATADSEPARE
jgi:thioredoxin reductase